ncbi:MAG: hypothetical protein LBK70_03345 [Clostridiales bacterium]|jgi:hypothetical protein|nr:hypothetical protein [Clostridiales bacterium]
MRQSNSAKNMSYAGIATALSTTSVVLGGLAPVVFSVMPMVVCPLSFWILVKRSNWWVGMLSVLAVLLLVIALLGFNLLVIVEYILYIVPYSVVLVLIHRLKYNLSTGLLRVSIVIVLSAVSTTIAVVFFFELLGYDTISYATGAAIYLLIYGYNVVTAIALDWVLVRVMVVLVPKIFKQDNVAYSATDVANNDIFE